MRCGRVILQTESQNDETAKERQELALNERNPFKTWEYWLFFETLLRKGFKDYLITRRREDGLYPAISNFVRCYVGPSVEGEIKRRAEKHQGFEAFQLLWAAEFADDEIAQEALGKLKKYVGNVSVGDAKFSERMLEAVRNREFNFPDLQSFDEAWQHVEGETFKVIKEGWGKLDLYEALGKAIDGMLNIAPRRVANRITDFMRKHKKREKWVVLFQERGPREKPGSASEDEPIEIVDEEGERKGIQEIFEETEEEKKWKSWEALFLSKELSSEETTVYKDTLEKVTGGDPLKKHYLNSRAEGRTDEQIAEELHVTPRTLRNWRKEMREREK